jgi:uncharacterized protein YbbC (DUF1343 family)
LNKFFKIAALIVLFTICFSSIGFAETPGVKLGNEVLLEKYRHLIEGKRVGLITNQTGVNSSGKSIIDIFANDPDIQLRALYGPEHGIDGVARAGAYVESYIHEKLSIPVYSLYGKTRKPTEDMLKDIDILIFDIQDIGARSYTYISTLNYCMIAAQNSAKPILVLDRPNPIGGLIVEGPVLEDPYKTFVGVDNLPKAHGMTIGELAKFFNRNIGADLTIIPMEGYSREMIFQDTGLTWVQTSPNIPDIDSLFGYMATGLGEGTSIFQRDKFKWIGGNNLDAQKFADLLNNAGLPGVTFIPEVMGTAGGARLKITNFHQFNPAKTGLHALAIAQSLTNYKVPKSTPGNMVMFDKIMGTDKIGIYLEQKLTPKQIEANYTPGLNQFKEERKKYLIYGESGIRVLVKGEPIIFDPEPFIDENNRLMVPLRAIVEALGGDIGWNPQNREAAISKGELTVLFTIDSTTAIVNGQIMKMDTNPVIKNSRTMVPVRYVSEYLGAFVDWDHDTKTVTIE